MVLLLFNDSIKGIKELHQILDCFKMNNLVDDLVIQHTYELKSINMHEKAKYIKRFLESHTIVIKFIIFFRKIN